MTRDTTRVAQMVSEALTMHVPGRSVYSRTYLGGAEILKVFHESGAATGRSIKIELHDVVGGPDHVVALHRMSGHRGDKVLDQNGCSVWSFRDGVTTGVWLAFENLRQWDDFWS